MLEDNKDVELEGGFEDFDKKKKTSSKKRGRKSLEGDEKTDQQGIRMRNSAWLRFRLAVNKYEGIALSEGKKKPTDGDVFEIALNLLEKELSKK